MKPAFKLMLTHNDALMQIKIWEDRKAQPLVVLRPHDGQPVNAATFLTAPHRPDHIILITAVCFCCLFLWLNDHLVSLLAPRF